MYCGMIKPAFIILCLNFWLPDAGAVEMTLENLQNMYKNITPGYELCSYYGTHCIRGQQYCSAVEKTCKSLFPKDATQETKLATCKDVIQRNETVPGVYDACIYFFGKQEIHRGFEKNTEAHLHDTHPVRTPGKELCRYPDQYCQLGSEFCNTTSGNCDPLFSPNASDTEKRQRCVQVIRTNITMLSDACTYALGKMCFSEHAGADEMTLEDLQNMYKNITPGYELCSYYGTHCIRGEQYCSAVEKTCTSLFPNNATSETKLATCKDVIQRNETEPGVYDGCIYFFGKLEILRGFGKVTDHPHDTHLIRAPGKELCQYPDTFCQLGSEFCNFTSGNCEPLFPHGTNDTEKRQWCVQVIHTNITMLTDACTYALGIMHCSESNVTDKKAAGQGNHTDTWGIIATVIAVVLAIAIIAIISFIVYIKYKKLLWFKDKQPVPQTSAAIHLIDVSHEAQADAGDREAAAKALRRVNSDNNDNTALDAVLD